MTAEVVDENHYASTATPETAITSFSDPVTLGKFLGKNKGWVITICVFVVSGVVASLLLWRGFWIEHWGDIASVIGLIITVVGFIWTIRLEMESKTAAERAEAAANQARESIQHFDAIIVISQACAHLSDIMEIHREKEWWLLPQRYAQVRKMLVSVKSSASRLNESQRVRVAGVLRQLGDIDVKIEACVYSEKENATPTKPLAMLEILKTQIDHLTDVLSELRNSRSL